MRRILSLTAALIIGLCSAVSAESLDGVAKIRVIDGWTLSDGRHVAALQVDLAPGWKTYWRAPGDAGIPPRFSWTGSDIEGGVGITWPTPKVFHQNGMRSVGYQDQLILPVVVTPRATGGEARLRGEVEVGLCREVCIPWTLSFDGPLTPGETARNPVISAALANRPYSADEAGVRTATCRVSPLSDGGLRVEARIAMPSAGGAEHAVIESGDPKVWASEAKAERQGGELVATSDLYHAEAPQLLALNRSQLRITVLGRNHAVDIRGCRGTG